MSEVFGMLVTPFGNVKLKLDNNGRNLSNGIEIEILPKTETQYFIFGVAWLKKCSEENDIQTWFAADPTITGTKINWTKNV